MRAKAFGFRMMAFDPFVEELVMSPYGVEPATLEEVLQNSGLRLDACPGYRVGAQDADREAFQDDET